LQISGLVHELNEVGDIVSKHYPGSICGMKHLMANGNVVHAFSLYASTKVEMLEFNIACSHDTFHNNLKKDPERSVVSANWSQPPNNSNDRLYPGIVSS
jgi:hypothetical protein